MELLIGLLLALNIGTIIYALIDIVKSNFHKPRQVKTGWIWIVILFQGPGSLIYFLTKEKRMGWSFEVEADLIDLSFHIGLSNPLKKRLDVIFRIFFSVVNRLPNTSPSPNNLCFFWGMGKVNHLLVYTFLQVLLLSVLWYCENLIIFPLVSTQLYEKTFAPLFGIGLRYT